MLSLFSWGIKSMICDYCPIFRVTLINTCVLKMIHCEDKGLTRFDDKVSVSLQTCIVRSQISTKAENSQAYITVSLLLIYKPKQVLGLPGL